MDFDADDIFKDDSDNELSQGNGEDESDFHVAMTCISESLRKQIISAWYDEVAICFFNTRGKRNLQDLNGVYVFNVAERDYLDRPKARLIKEVSNVEALQRYYAVLQALALDEDDIPEIKDETLPDEQGMSRPAVVRVVEEFMHSVYGEDYDEESEVGNAKASETMKKRKSAAENAVKEFAKHDWADLADNGKLKNMTVVDLKCYLTANNLPLAGTKEALISRILTHMGK